MPSKKRDPLFTRNVRLPWGPDSSCPCGSEKRAADCCRLADGFFYKPVRVPTPPEPKTNYVHPRCYLKDTKNCSTKISGEHFLSASTLRLIDERFIRVKGVPWLPAGEIGEFPIERLKAKILCKRHNEALSGLDASAGDFFGGVREIFDDIANLRTLSRKAKWFMFSGEELELWLLKTAFGLYESGSFADERGTPPRRPIMSPFILRAFQGVKILPPCGLYVTVTDGEARGNRNAVDVSPIYSESQTRIVGMALTFMGLSLVIALDPQASYKALEKNHKYRPAFLQFRNPKRFHSIVLT